MIKIKQIRNLCSAGTYANGLDICKPGKIRKARIDCVDAETVNARALVLGNFGYYHNVQIALDSRKSDVLDDFRCDCYEQTTMTTPCRHCVALALALACDGDNALGLALAPQNAAFEKPGLEKVTAPEGTADADSQN